MKLLLIGGFIGLLIGVAITVCHYSLTTFLAVSAKTLRTTQNMAEIANETADDVNRTEAPSSAKDESSRNKGVLR